MQYEIQSTTYKVFLPENNNSNNNKLEINQTPWSNYEFTRNMGTEAQIK